MSGVNINAEANRPLKQGGGKLSWLSLSTGLPWRRLVHRWHPLSMSTFVFGERRVRFGGGMVDKTQRLDQFPCSLWQKAGRQAVIKVFARPARW